MDKYFEFDVKGGDFKNIGFISSNIKKLLLKLGINKGDVRRVAISLFETETNIISYTRGGKITIAIENNKIIIKACDEGPGIKDISLAMKEGFSTATEIIRRLGFGAGMGLSNIKKNTDILYISSKEGDSTKVVLTFLLK
jgi:anti-sigma regulatory factor (Ser/Thr protein kinase)